MNNRYKIVFVISLIIAFSIFTSCEIKEAKQNWEYIFVMFDREDSNMQNRLNTLGENGWEYAGPLCNNGINATYVAFKRPLK